MKTIKRILWKHKVRRGISVPLKSQIRGERRGVMKWRRLSEPTPTNHGRPSIDPRVTSFTDARAAILPPTPAQRSVISVRTQHNLVHTHTDLLVFMSEHVRAA